MNTKIIAIAVVAVIAVAAVGAYVVLSNNDSDADMNIIGRVNTDGSAILLKNGENSADYVTIVNEKPPSGYYLGGNDTWVVFNKETWGGKIFTDPGASTIQHVQLNDIANAMGLKFVQYSNTVDVSEDTLYFIPGVPTYEKFKSELNNNSNIVGGVFWEPQTSIAVLSGDKCSMMATTNQLFPGHTCCTIAAQHSYISSHKDETVRFLAAYVESVKKMTAAIGEGSGESYDKVIEVAMDSVNLGSDMKDEAKKAAIVNAFRYVVYTYADDSAGSLDALKKDIADMAEKFANSKTAKNDAAALGFDSYNALASKFVDSSYMKDAMKYERPEKVSTANITVAVIGGDIHQLAIHYGIAMGIFDEYGIKIKLSTQSNGPAVYTAMKNNDAQFGFIGAPPMTINSMNDKTI